MSDDSTNYDNDIHPTPHLVTHLLSLSKYGASASRSCMKSKLEGLGMTNQSFS